MADLPLRPVPTPKQSYSKDKSGRGEQPYSDHSSFDSYHKVKNEVVPFCDVYLDNSNTISLLLRPTDPTPSNYSLDLKSKPDKNLTHWIDFKTEILKLAQNLKLDGWQNIPVECAQHIGVERVSGALTNAVYVISQPTFLRSISSGHEDQHAKHSSDKALLRIYGHQFNQLIDRENELRILKRLAQKNIGPKVLGTFKNGRFEEYFHAKTLGAEDIRNIDTSKQIAKRMRELHDGVELLEQERNEGPFVWRNWDKWIDRCEEIMKILDDSVRTHEQHGILRNWKTRGFVCGVEWPQFKSAAEKYRKWLNDYCGKENIRQNLVFAHNDTQYGNILRLLPENHVASFTPPPLLPDNTYKNLVFIDFEYASANTPGLELANHFSEWCYNYHSPTKPWLCDTKKYPSLEEQKVFITSYVTHRSQFNPRMPIISEVNNLKRSYNFGLSNSQDRSDSVTNLGCSTINQESLLQEPLDELEVQKQVLELLEETRIWRAANSCQWIIWGIVQAQIPELFNTSTTHNLDRTVEAGIAAIPTSCTGTIEQTTEPFDNAEVTEHDEGYDYLSYALDRALFFWGDLLSLGIVSKEELPSELIERIKFVNN
ncbi:Choline kinase [Erysiphe necator]|nr:Choline kinase [Erysiphe necator]